jgi:prophage regulatory protein
MRTAVPNSPNSDNAVQTTRPINGILGANPADTFLGSCIPEACLRIGAVSSITGLSKPTIYREIAKGQFPRPIKLTASARAWKLSEIMEWINTRERDAAPVTVDGEGVGHAS